MVAERIRQWIEHPELLDKESLYELRNLVARYPYYQTLRVLYLKNLYLLHDISFGSELRKSIVYISNRKELFMLIEGEHYRLKPNRDLLRRREEEASEETGDRTLFLIDSFLAQQPEETQVTELDYALDYSSFLMDDEETAETPKFRGQELIDSFIDKAEAEEELPAEREAAETCLSEENNSFEPEKSAADITEESKSDEDIAPEKSACADELHGNEEKAAETSDEVKEEEQMKAMVAEPREDEFFTETLAKIYIKQHRYEKALEIIKKISLKYPKKNAYFADQIRFLEKLIINAKSK